MGSCADYIDFTQKNKPQGNALSGGIFVLLVAGIQIGWIFDDGIRRLKWADGHGDWFVSFVYAGFYIGGVIGLFAASTTINRLTKSNIYYSSLIFVTFASGMLVLLPNNFYIIMVSRLMMGFAYGYAYLTSLVHASEIVHQKLRGMIVAGFQVCLMSSAILTTTLSSTLSEASFEGFQWLGSIGILYSVMGIIFTVIFTRESPVSLMREKKFDQAISIMIKVRNESEETWSIRNEFNELRTMVEEDEMKSKDVFDEGNFRPLTLIVLLKIAFVISFNYGVNVIRLSHSTSFMTEEGYSLATMVYFSTRLFAMLVTLFSIDLKGRRFHFMVSHMATAILFCILAIIVLSDPKDFQFGFVAINILLEIAAGIGMGIVADVYSCEAFDTLKKPRSIFVTSSVGYALHIAIIFTTFDAPTGRVYEGVYLLASGVLLVAITIILYRQLPETSKMSIRQTRTEFLRNGEIVFSGSNKSLPTSIYD